MPRSRYRIYDDQYPHFLTCTVVNWIPIFSSPPIEDIVYDSRRFLQDNGRLELYAFVILENHVHLIASSPSLAKEIGDLKSFTARRIIDYLKDKGARRVLEQLARVKVRYKAGGYTGLLGLVEVTMVW